ncbi:MAG: hypothetical protein HGA31_02515 [Candidatus Moranbacteria bacterium]|nr:hypothetical protein [Candidatus Moranbacteria bacterium]
MNRKTVGERLKSNFWIFCDGMVCRRNIERDAAITLVAILVAGTFLFLTGHLGSFNVLPDVPVPEVAGTVVEQPPLSEEQVASEVQAIEAPYDTSTWKLYANPYYGFELRYPSDWSVPVNVSAPKGSTWEYRYRFRSPSTGGTYIGFDVVIYDVAKAKELSGTDEFPPLKNGTLVADPSCKNIEGHVIDTGDYPASEIYIPPENQCYQPTLFFTMIRDRYVYDIVPILADGAVTNSDPRISINEHFREFYPIAGSVLLTGIVRPEPPKVETSKPAPPKPAPPKITAPHPVSYKKENGRLVCAKKNDHPSKSKQHKGKHLDMECCLDPDEYPNPWCYYPKDKYGKYL